MRCFVEAGDVIRDRVARLIAQVHRREAVQGLVDGALLRGAEAGELLHGCRPAVRAEHCLAAHPVSALAGNRALGESVLQPDLELGPEKASFALGGGNMELPALLDQFVGGLLEDERGRGEDEFETFNLLQLFS